MHVDVMTTTKVVYLLKFFYDGVLMENMHGKQSVRAETLAHTREHHIKMQLKRVSRSPARCCLGV